MFYPVDSLKRGGRFYLCWVADSWPVRFATITPRQLWSQDIRRICDDLIEVMTNESGHPAKRFSLRLSSQLMRGLVRIYQKKTSLLMNDLCMINAHVFRHANQKFHVYEVSDHPHRERVQRPAVELPQLIQLEEEHEQNQPRVEELLQNSGNVVANIQDITLREAAIPEILPPNDGFGEENPEQALQGLDRTLEIMLVGGLHPQSAQSALDIDKSHDKTHDKSRHDLLMENISELNATMFRRSDGEGLLPMADFEKEIPEIPDIPIPELPVLQEKQLNPPVEIVEIPEVPIDPPIQPEAVPTREYEPIVLEELEEGQQRPKRRKHGLIIDKSIKLTSSYLQARINNPRVELRCQESSEDRIIIRTSGATLMRRPTRWPMALELTRMFQMNLGYIHRPEHDTDMEIQEAVMRPQPNLVRSMLDAIQEEPIPQEIPQIQREPENIANRDLPLQDIGNITGILNVTDRHRDIELEPTQKIDTLSQVRKRTSKRDDTMGPSPRKLRRSTLRVSRDTQNMQQEMEVDTVAPGPNKECVIPEIQIEAPENLTAINVQIDSYLSNLEADKENAAANIQTSLRRKETQSLSELLQRAGLADIEAQPAGEIFHEVQRTERRTSGKGSDSETPLGSLDRTKVSLGESDSTTDSKRFIRNEWGTEGTMKKILRAMKRNEIVNVLTLVEAGPVLHGYKAIIAARCFTSILKLKQYGFIKIIKKPNSLEIEDITLGRLLNY